jgi:hypothetical protein
MKMGKKIKSFVKQYVAELQGDTDKAQAEKVFRSIDSSLATHIAIKKGKTIFFQDQVDNAKEVLRKARLNNSTPLSFEDRDVYVEKLIKAKNDLTQAELDLESHMEVLTFLEKEYNLLQEEEDEAEA